MGDDVLRGLERTYERLMAGASPDAIDPRTGRSAREARPTLFKKLGLPAAPKRPRREAD